jgi:hypothetical protein
MGLSFKITDGPRQRSHSQVRVPRDHHILLSQIRDSTNLEGQVHIFIFPRKRVAQLYPQALGSLFVAYYDSQGYGANRIQITTSYTSRCHVLILCYVNAF